VQQCVQPARPSGRIEVRIGHAGAYQRVVVAKRVPDVERCDHLAELPGDRLDRVHQAAEQGAQRRRLRVQAPEGNLRARVFHEPLPHRVRSA
jgi:hypothetical protein